LWTDKVLDGSIKLLFNLAGNTLINQHSDINRTKEILSDPKKCEFIVVSDTFMTPSARFADILLPAPSFLETENIPYTNREGDYLLYNNVVAKPLFESRFEYDWLKDLAGQLGLRGAFTQGNESAQDWLRFAYRHLAENVAELPPFDEFARNGGYAYAAQTEYIAFRDQAGTPEADRDAAPFATPSGKVEIFSERLFALGDEGIPGLPGYVPGFEGPADPRAAEYPLQMVGWHTKRRCHSIHDNNPWMDKIEKPFVHMNKSDAEARGIREGDLAIVWNDRGKMKIPAHVSGDIMRGVCAVAQGAWHTPDEDGTDVRGSVNILTTSRPTPLANGNPQHSNLVEIRRAT
jgi:anaerobic dimethyl sulfoxide reductase subunit A